MEIQGSLIGSKGNQVQKTYRVYLTGIYFSVNNLSSERPSTFITIINHKLHVTFCRDER